MKIVLRPRALAADNVDSQNSRDEVKIEGSPHKVD